MTEKKERIGSEIPLVEGMENKTFDLSHIVSMRDHLAGVVQKTVPEQHYGLAIAGMWLLIVEAVKGHKDQLIANADNTIAIYEKIQEIEKEGLKDFLKNVKIEGKPA